MRSPKAGQPYFSFLHSKNEELPDATYFDPKLFSWVNALEEKFPEIKNEILHFMSDHAEVAKPYFAKDMMNAPEKWKAFSFLFWKKRQSKMAIRECPKTTAALQQIDGLVSASVSMLEPHSFIKPHYGDTDAVFRCHLPLVVPAGLPMCGFRVGYEDRAWEEGKTMIFNDAAYHKAWNETDSRRIVLLFDVMKPEYRKKENWICAMVLASIVFQLINKVIPIIRKERGPIARFFFFGIAGILYAQSSLLKRKSAWL